MNETRPDAEKENLGILTNIGKFFSVVGTLIALAVWSFFILIVGVFERLWHVQNSRRVDKEKFWGDVGKCLVEFHGMTSEQAVDLILTQRQHLVRIDRMLFLKQPFKVANFLAGFDVKLSQEDYDERYLRQILGKK